MKTLGFIEKSRTTQLATQRHIAEDRNPISMSLITLQQGTGLLRLT